MGLDAPWIEAQKPGSSVVRKSVTPATTGIGGGVPQSLKRSGAGEGDVGLSIFKHMAQVELHLADGHPYYVYTKVRVRQLHQERWRRYGRSYLEICEWIAPRQGPEGLACERP